MTQILPRFFNSLHCFNPDPFRKVRDNWGKIGPFKLFDQHEDEITEEVVRLSNEVAAIISSSVQNWSMKKVARYYLGEEGIGNFDADHIQVVRRRLIDNTLKKNTTGHCGHVLRCMVLGHNG